MIEVEKNTTYPYLIRCWPPEGDELQNRAKMMAWLDANVKWNGNLDIKQQSPKGENRTGTAALHYIFRVHSLEDVGLVKMRC